MRACHAVLLAATAALGLAACGAANGGTDSEIDTLNKRDPAGWQACNVFMNRIGSWAEGSTDEEAAVGAPLLAWDYAIDSTTPAIHASIDEDFDLAGYGMVKGDELIEACKAEGMTVQPGSVAEQRAHQSS